jgi:O-antigen ligase
LTGVRPEWFFTALISAVSLVLLTGTVVTIAGGLLDYPGAVVRLALICASLIFLSLLFLRDAIRLDRRAVPSISFAMVAILSVVASPGFTSALLRLELYYAIVVAGCAVGFALRHCSDVIGKIVLLSIAVVHAGFLLIAVQFAVAAPVGADPVAPPPYFLNIRHFGYQGFFGASAAVAVALADRRLRAVGILLATAALFGIVMFGSRGALLAWIVFVAGVIALAPRRRAAVVLVLLVVSGALALAIVAENYGWMNTYSLLDRTRIPTGDTVSVLYVNDRVEIWLDSLLTIAQRPILGFGPNGYILSGCCNRSVAQPHNSILQILLEFGVVGLVTLTWAVVSLFGPRVRAIVHQTTRSDRDSLQVAALAIVAAFAAFSLIDGLLYFPVPLVNFALVCAVFLAAPSSRSLRRAWTSSSKCSMRIRRVSISLD